MKRVLPLLSLSLAAATARADQPQKVLDSCEGGPRAIRVSGWAYDPDVPSRSVDVHVYLYTDSDCTSRYGDVRVLAADRPRPDVNEAKGVEGDHGFDEDLVVADAGDYWVKVFAIDATGDGNPQIGTTRAATVTDRPWLGYEFIVGDLRYKVVGDDSQRVKVSAAAASTNISGIVTIPDTVDFRGIDCAVTGVEDGGFANCDGIAEVVVGDNVERIGAHAFDSVGGLRTVSIGQYVSSIGALAFGRCRALVAVTMKRGNPPTLASDAFDGCDALARIVVPGYAFYDYSRAAGWGGLPGVLCAACGSGDVVCRYDPDAQALFICGSGDMDSYNDEERLPPWHRLPVATAVVGDGVTSIGAYAFYEKYELSSVTIGSAVINIGCHAFDSCTSLKSVIIPAGVHDVEDFAFRGCSSLKSVYIGGDVRGICLDSFLGCSAVRDVYCFASPAALSWDDPDSDDFKLDGSTVCHVFGNPSAWGGHLLNLTFVGDLGDLPVTYELWSVSNRVVGAWNAIDANGVHNVFRYAFDDTNAVPDPAFLSISFDADGRPVVLTPPLNPTARDFFDFELLAAEILDESAFTDGTNLVLHSTFDTDISGWDTYREAGGGCTLYGADGKLALKVSRVGSKNYSVQVFHDGVPLYRNGRYRLKYDISSTTDRFVEAMIHEAGGTYQTYTWRGLDITPEPQTVDYEFTMDQDTDTMSKLVFNCGLQEKDPNLPEHTIYLDNVSLELLNPEEFGPAGASWPLSPTGTNVIAGDILPVRFFRLRAKEK